ncbi:ABC transporter ATP-binding protein [Vagococcus sp. BWB3-3]|uniref:ABC transporter ATP-binding protein n=1 Tax=Vagococcus allomyrinae TaxID=2794353 RepID=A0A940P9K5_9ENTE|nr:ABC transporter ATP-binding protein [Vagococcus allomyrinae]MBP1040630.1 ABC transporter ATP-binding protein [Vagococcus allomyrinae]
MKTLLEVKELNKTFECKKVVKNLSFSIYEKEILCLLGPNGAGKSTTINILTGALSYDSGQLFFHQRKLQANDRGFKRKIGVVPQDLALYEELSAEVNVTFFASLYGLKGEELKNKVTEALAFVGLGDRRKSVVKTFSGGMKRRLNIACGMAHGPELLIMDEPTVGIDPQSRLHILTAIRRLRDQGMTILYTTHYMEEVEEISDRIIIIDQGEILASGSKEELKAAVANEQLIEIEVSEGKLIAVDQLYSLEGVKEASLSDNKVSIKTLKNIDNLDRIIGKLLSFSIKIKNISIESANLETVFLQLTGRTLRD